MTLPMRVGLGQFNTLTDEILTFIKQIGVNDFLMNMVHGASLPGNHQWEYEDLAALKARADQADLRFMAIENVPFSFYDKIMLGLQGRDKQITHMQTTIRNIGKANIPTLGYHWVPNGVWRTPEPAVLASGARGTRFDMAAHKDAEFTHDREFTADEMWENYQYYLERILPVAEEAGVRLALHPDDPPVPSLGGIARIFGSFEAFNGAMERFDSPNHGLNFCMGCWSEMGGHNSVIKAIRHFGSQQKIVYVHFRDVQGNIPCFNECFIGDGNVNTYEVIKTLKEVGFNGFMIPDHVPATDGDSNWHHRGRAHAIGYMKALLQVVEQLP